MNHPIPSGVTGHPPNVPIAWFDHERSTGWKLDATTGTFVGRPLTQHDTHRWTYDDFGPEPLLQLGAPGLVLTQSKRWSPTVDKFGLQVLNAAGFINGNVPPEYTKQIYDPKGMLSSLYTDPIHPVICRDMWFNITDHQYNLIKPGLQLATAILDTPDCLKFFSAYFSGYKEVYSPHMKENIKIVKIPSQLSPEDLKHLYKRFTDMRSFTSFHIGQAGPMGNNMAETEALTTPGMVPGSKASKITINEEWLDALQFYLDPTAEQRINNYQHYHGMDPDRRIHISAQTTRLNVLTQFAELIIHELSHAVVFSGVQIPPGGTLYLEPFFQQNRTGEAGYAVEKHIFGGHFFGHVSKHDTTPIHSHAPYGMNMMHDFDFYKQGKDPSPRIESVFPVPAIWGALLFSKMHWDLIDRFGAGYLRIPEFPEWTVWRVAPSP